MRTQKTLISITMMALLVSGCADQSTDPDKVTAVKPSPEIAALPQQLPQTPVTPQPAVDTSSRETANLHNAAAGKVAAEVESFAQHRMMSDAAYVSMPHYPVGIQQIVDRENYLPYPENGVKQVSQEPVSTFSIDVDTAGYANVRRMLVQEGRLPPADAVRLEEMINYFSYSYPQPVTSSEPFAVHTELATAPWSENHKLLQIGLKGFEPPAAERPAANLVFLIDVSGSMRAANKLGLVKRSLRLLVNNMTAQDRIAIAVYAGAAGTVLESTPGDQKATILQAINTLEAGGSTHGSAGIKLAYNLAQQHAISEGINRVIIASDGDMNVGTVNLEALKDLIERKRESGIALTTLGFGAGNYNYALMEQLADVGNGNAAYIDSLKEAQKVLVNEMQSTLLTIASDVKIQIEFNPELVSEYRLIGYENRMLNREDFNNDKVDAGEIGAGHTVTALYEVVLAGSEGERIDALRYVSGSDRANDNRTASEPTAANSIDTDELAYVKLRYKTPSEQSSQLMTHSVLLADDSKEVTKGSADLRFAASVAGFGQLLQGGTFTGQWSYDDALELARHSRGDDLHGYRSELIHLIELARSLSSKS